MLEIGYRHVFFRPWIGASYGPQSGLGLPLLVLGEAHYEWPGGTLDEDTTRGIIREVVEDGQNGAFWTKSAGAFIGRKPNPEERSTFWNSVAFYNFVQCPLPAARKRPTPEMWQAGVEPFIEVLSKHAPRCIIVLGKELWNHLPRAEAGHDLSSEDGQSRPTRIYRCGTTAALATSLNHPSSGGWGYEKWHPWVMRALKAARSV